jgi:gamma-tubulin complex component 5
MPPGSIKNQNKASSDSDASSLWSLDTDDLDIDHSSDSLPTPPRSPSPVQATIHFPPSLPDIRLSVLHRKEVENLQSKQYWRSDWKMPVKGINTRFDIGDASTLGMSMIFELRCMLNFMSRTYSSECDGS